MRNTCFHFLILILASIFCQFQLVLSQQTTIIPLPSLVDVSEENRIPFPAKIVFQNNPFLTDELNFFRSLVQVNGNWIQSDTTSFSDATLLRFVYSENRNEEAYNLVIDKDIIIEASTKKGFFYGMISLIQMRFWNQNQCYLPTGFIQDSPDFSWRGLHLDVSRHFFSVDEIKQLLDVMAFYKLNRFHWHLTDDQGWRIEIKQFPKLTEVGAWRDSTLIGHYNDMPHQFDRTRYGGFYSQEQIKEIVSYAQSRQIEVVPEIEMPGHARAALAAYPDLGCTHATLPVESRWGVFEDVFCSKTETIQFLQAVLTEIIPLFPGKFVHIGGDEAPKKRWQSCPNCQNVMQQNQLKNEQELQSFFIRQMDHFLTAKGKTLIGWDEILEGGLSPNAAVMSWRGDVGGREAAMQKHTVVMTPNSHCYLDYYQSGNPTEPLAIGGYLPLEKVYTFSPIPTDLPDEFHAYILGGQANLWTEYIPDFKQANYMLFPRMLALSEKVWNKNGRSYADFLSVVSKKHFPLLDSMGFSYSKAVFYPQVSVTRTQKGIAYTFEDQNQKSVFKNDLGKPMDLFYKIPISGKDSLKYSFVKHLGLGAKVHLISQPNKAYNERGDLSLVDGIKGKKPWKGHEWLGFLQDTVVFEVELTKTTKVNSVSLGFLDAKGSWIYLPDQVNIFFSQNGKKWEQVTSTEITESTMFMIEQKARFFRIEIIPISAIPSGAEGAGHHPWTFIDEFQVE